MSKPFDPDMSLLVERMREIQKQIAAAEDLAALKRALDTLCDWLAEDEDVPVWNIEGTELGERFEEHLKKKEND